MVQSLVLGAVEWYINHARTVRLETIDTKVSCIVGVVVPHAKSIVGQRCSFRCYPR
jgi:hypothetical protein